MQIRPIPFTADPQGLPAKSFAYHVGLPNENPVNDANKIDVFDGQGGSQASNPFYVDVYGRWSNLNGTEINPWIDAEQYSVTVLAPSGAELIAISNVVSDNVAPSDIEAGVVDAVINNLNDPTTGAKVLDLSSFETVYIKSLDAAWEDTVPGPIGGFYAHRDGTTSAASTGDENQFYDATGTGFTRDLEQRLKPDGVTIDVSTLTNEISVSPTVSAIDGYIYGLDTSCSNGDDVDITDGKCVDSTNSIIIEVGAQNADIKAVIPSGNRANGTLVEGTYYIFVVSEADGSNPKIAFDTSIVATNALIEWSAVGTPDYTLYRLIGFAVTDSGIDIIDFNHIGDEWFWHEGIQDYAVTAVGVTTQQLATLALPVGVRVNPKSMFYAEDLSPTSNTHFLLLNTDQSDVAPDATHFNFRITNNIGTSNLINMNFLLSDTDAKIAWRAESSTDRNFAIFTTGWRFKR